MESNLDVVEEAERGQQRSVERLSVNLSSEVAAVLRSLAEKHNVTVTEMVRRAILTEDYFDKAIAEDYRVRLYKKGEPLRELVFK